MSVPHHPALNAYPFTVAAWINTVQFPDPMFPFIPVISKSPFASDGWSIQLLNGQVYASYSVDGATRVPGISGGFVADGQWRHVAFVVDASGGKLYLNGVLQTSQPWLGAPGPPSTTVDMTFGSLPMGLDTPHFEGFLDEIAVWNAPLSQAQIQFNMNRSLTGTESGLIAYYRCDETTYGTSLDSAPAAGINNGSWFGAVGTGASGVQPFTPFVKTLAPGPLGTTNTTLNGVGNPEGANTTVWFQWGTTTNYGNLTARQPIGNAANNTNFSQAITGLALDVTYEFRAVASNIFGVVFGTNQSIPSHLFSPVATNFPGVYFSAAAWGDYDNDGRLDILLTGLTNSTAPPITQVWRNTGSGFTNINAALPGVFYPSVAWSDYDNDGRLDFLLTGDTNWVGPVRRADLLSQVWRNTGNAFININAGLPSVLRGAIAWGDYDNDGRPDILLTGDTNYSLSTLSIDMISQVWRNTSTGFTKINLALPGVDLSSVAWVDYDNDGRLDIFLSGRTNAFGQGVPIVQVWRNTGHGFTNINAGLPGVTLGACAWGDYDHDGRLDVLLTGFSDYSLPSSSNIISQVWRNTGNGFSNINAGLPGIAYSSVAWGDYDNDGRLDILLAGATNFTSTYHATGFVSQVWRNTGTGFTRVNAGLPGVVANSCAWGDYDNDGRLDILLTGATKADADGNVLEAISQVWRNNVLQMNTSPTAPTNLTATVAGNTVTFSWSAASDVQTPSGALSYNLRVGTFAGGSDVAAPMAAPNGLRRLPQWGNAGQNRFRTMALPPGPLYWSVQVVDSALAGGPFSAEAFILLRPSLTIFRTPGGVLLSWPASTEDYALQATPRLVGNPPPWLSVPPPYVTNGESISISNSAAGESRYYRLRRP